MHDHEIIVRRPQSVVRRPGVGEHDRVRGDEEERPVRLRLLVWTKELTLRLLHALVEAERDSTLRGLLWHWILGFLGPVVVGFIIVCSENDPWQVLVIGQSLRCLLGRGPASAPSGLLPLETSPVAWRLLGFPLVILITKEVGIVTAWEPIKEQDFYF